MFALSTGEHHPCSTHAGFWGGFTGHLWLWGLLAALQHFPSCLPHISALLLASMHKPRAAHADSFMCLQLHASLYMQTYTSDSHTPHCPLFSSILGPVSCYTKTLWYIFEEKSHSKAGIGMLSIISLSDPFETSRQPQCNKQLWLSQDHCIEKVPASKGNTAKKWQLFLPHILIKILAILLCPCSFPLYLSLSWPSHRKLTSNVSWGKCIHSAIK